MEILNSQYLLDYQIRHYSELFLGVNHSYDEYPGELSISEKH